MELTREQIRAIENSVNWEIDDIRDCLTLYGDSWMGHIQDETELVLDGIIQIVRALGYRFEYENKNLRLKKIES